MKTDLDNLRKMLDSKGIQYDTNSFNNETIITIKRGGYTVYTEFVFDMHGEFMNVGAYES
jgi:hypothetical protein